MMIDIEAINKTNIPESYGAKGELQICWIMAAHTQNTDTLKYRFHTHNFFELHFVLSGHVSYEFEGKTVTLHKDGYTVIPPMLPHKVLEHSEDFIKVTVAFEVSGRLLEALNGIRLAANSMSEDIKTELLSVSAVASRMGQYTDELVNVMLEKLVWLVVDKVGKPTAKSPKRHTDSRVLRAKRLIEDNPNIFFTASEVACYCGLSLKQLGRLFKAYEGKGVLEFIHEQKTKDAILRITESTDPLECISLGLGFADVSYFNKFFLRNVGVTPGEYRRTKEEL